MLYGSRVESPCAQPEYMASLGALLIHQGRRHWVRARKLLTLQPSGTRSPLLDSSPRAPRATDVWMCRASLLSQCLQQTFSGDAMTLGIPAAAALSAFLQILISPPHHRVAAFRLLGSEIWLRPQTTIPPAQKTTFSFTFSFTTRGPNSLKNKATLSGERACSGLLSGADVRMCSERACPLRCWGAKPLRSFRSFRFFELPTYSGPLGPLGVDFAQHRQTLRPSVEGSTQRALVLWCFGALY